MALSVLLWPTVTYLHSIVSNQTLEMSLTILLTLNLVTLYQEGLSRFRAVGLGIALGCALLTKVNFLLFVPFFLLIAIYTLWKKRTCWFDWMIVLLISGLIAGWWYLGYAFASRHGLVDARQSAEQCTQFIPYLWQIAPFARLRQFWSEQLLATGHRDTYLPSPLLAYTYLFAYVSLLGWLRQALRPSADWWHNRYIVWAIATLTLWVTTILFFWFIGYTVSCDRVGEYNQGRLILPFFLPLLITLFLGWFALFPRHAHHLAHFFLVIFIVLQFVALYHNVGRRYYGSQLLYKQEERAVLTPLAPHTPLTFCHTSPDKTTIDRLDLWLHHPGGSQNRPLTISLSNSQGHTLLSARPLITGWNDDYPSYLYFDPIELEAETCFTLLSASADATYSLWQNVHQQPALRLYQPISILNWPQRLAHLSILPPLFFVLFPLSFPLFLTFYLLGGTPKKNTTQLPPKEQR